MVVDISGQGRVRVDEAGYVIGERLQSDSGCLAVEEPSLAQVGLERGGEVGRRPLARRSVKAKPPPGVSRAAPVRSSVPPVALSSIGVFVAIFVAWASMVALSAP